MKNYKLISLILALAVTASAFLTSCTTKDVPETPPETEPAVETEAPDPAAAYVYAGSNYTITETGASASATSPDTFTEIYNGAFTENELLDGDFAAELHVTLDSVKSNAGLLFRAEASESFDGFEGYAFTIRDKRVYLYLITGTASAGMKVTELGCRVVERPDRKDGCTLRVEKDGNTFRCYFCDDMTGVEPWPEFEFVLNDVRGTGIGYFDNGHGASFDSLAVAAIENPEVSGRTYKNPVFGQEQAADPGVLYYDGMYYCYSTSAPIGYYVYTSPDLVNWTNEGLCADMMWGLSRNGYYWAPEVFEKDGKFYMIASVEEHIGFAVADSPLGPFIPEENWLYDKAIDGHVFIDDDGRAYLYYVGWQNTYGIYGCELNDDMVSVKPGTTKLLLKPEDSWEEIEGSVTEGPFILKNNGTYYLTYSGTGYTSDYYAVGYATSDSPLGDYERYEANPVLSYTSKFHGPGHHSFTTSPDGSELWIVYHVHNTLETVHPRKICIDRARFVPTESGLDRLEIYGPNHTSQPYPAS
ncbi:MAG: glycoside hydrolase family 43 protein [Clostridia bacterium]|nr:glycoside hydrolase family 43 protein [Clostridia bacterium]